MISGVKKDHGEKVGKGKVVHNAGKHVFGHAEDRSHFRAVQRRRWHLEEKKKLKKKKCLQLCDEAEPLVSLFFCIYMEFK